MNRSETVAAKNGVASGETMARRAPSASPGALFSEGERLFVERHRLGHLATATASGAPHVIPVCYALVGDGVYFVVDDKPKRTRRGLKRLRNIRENSQVALVVDDYDEDWSRLAFLLIQGRAALVVDAQEYTAVLDQLRSRYAQYRAMALQPETHPMIRITAERVHLWRASAKAGA